MAEKAVDPHDPYNPEHPLLKHVLENDCADPDCEVHNPEVGIEEGVVDYACLAFWLAGASWMSRNMDCISPSTMWPHAIKKVSL